MPEAKADNAAATFDYDDAFSRNIGWVTEWEQLQLKTKKVAIAGLGGVGGVHLMTLARLGIGAFHVADLDTFEVVNFNRQVGASMSTVGRPKASVMADMAVDLNPELSVRQFPDGVNDANLDDFLDGVDLFVDGLDFFVLDVRAKVFARCAELGIPAVTAAPVGMGVGYLIFMPGGMTFEQYFRLQGLSPRQQYVNFGMGLVPKMLHTRYQMDPTRLDLPGKRGPSSAVACQLCAGVVGAEAIKILLGRGKVRPAPCYHQFDPYRGRWVSGRMWGGNRNPLQRLKLKIGYKIFDALGREAWQPPARETGPVIEQILDLARWAPSGDNTQPWTFEIEGPDKVTIHVRDQADDDIYDYNDGQPTLLSTGCLLESMRIAASRHGKMLWWSYEGGSANMHKIRVELPDAPGIEPDPLLPFVHMRSVDRRPYRATGLTPAQRQALTAALGDEFRIQWHETRGARWRLTRLNSMATNIRLRIPEAFMIHQRVMDWTHRRSPDRIPVGAVGLDAMTLKIMRWAMRDWSRMDRMNRISGTGAARLQLDYLPGLGCAAHYTVTRANPVSEEDRIPSLIRCGQAVQRFWLTATQLGLSMQPSMATAIFAHYGRHGIDFTGDAKIRRQAAELAGRLDGLLPGGGDDLLWMGRIGAPRSRRVGPRSIRKPLEALMVNAAERQSDAEQPKPAAAGPHIKAVG